MLVNGTTYIPQAVSFNAFLVKSMEIHVLTMKSSNLSCNIEKLCKIVKIVLTENECILQT